MKPSIFLDFSCFGYDRLTFVVWTLAVLVIMCFFRPLDTCRAVFSIHVRIWFFFIYNPIRDKTASIFECIHISYSIKGKTEKKIWLTLVKKFGMIIFILFFFSLLVFLIDIYNIELSIIPLFIIHFLFASNKPNFCVVESFELWLIIFW